MSEPTLESLAAELSALRGRVQELEDREEIHRLTREYMQAMHDARWEDAVECFSDDASYDHGILGELRTKDEIRKFYTEFMPSFEEAGGWAAILGGDDDSASQFPPGQTAIACCQPKYRFAN